MPLRGEIWNVNLDPAQGHEQAKTRPCVVISNNMVNIKLGISIVVPLTGTPHYLKSGRLSPTMVEILPPEGGTTKPSDSIAYQVRTVSHTRFMQQLGPVSNTTLDKIVLSVQNGIA
jgi:mRNA interferase MazF